jgi:L-amino acid N-acyltransferase
MPVPSSINIRPATPVDLPAINDIYNHYVLHSTCTYQEVPEPLEGREAWFARHGPQHPVIVAVDAIGSVIGWGSLSGYHARSAYRFTVENSVYLRHDLRGKGVGGLLLAELISLAKSLGHHSIIAGIDADQPASVALHRRAGFEQVGRMKQVGFKFGKWLDVIYMQLML